MMEVSATCKFIGTAEGCRKGSQCPFRHPGTKAGKVGRTSRLAPAATAIPKYCELCKGRIFDQPQHESTERHRKAWKAEKKRIADEKKAHAIQKQTEEAEEKLQIELAKQKLAAKEQRKRGKLAPRESHNQLRRRRALARGRDREARQKEALELKRFDKAESEMRAKAWEGSMERLCAKSIEQPQEEAEEGALCRLPDEILLFIFSFLDDYNDLLALALVNSRWLRVLQDSDIWKSMLVRMNVDIRGYSSDVNWKKVFVRNALRLWKAAPAVKVIPLPPGAPKMVVWSEETMMLITGDTHVTVDLAATINQWHQEPTVTHNTLRVLVRAAERLAKRAKDVQGDVIAYIEGENHDNIVLRDFFGNIRKRLSVAGVGESNLSGVRLNGSVIAYWGDSGTYFVKQEDSDDAEPFWHHAQPISDISFDPAVDPADNLYFTLLLKDKNQAKLFNGAFKVATIPVSWKPAYIHSRQQGVNILGLPKVEMAGSIAWVQDFLVVTEKYRRSTMNLTAYDLPSGTDLRVVFAPSGETPSWTMTSVGGREEQYLIGCSEQHITCWNMSRDKLSSSIHVALRPHSRFRVPSLIYSFQAGEFQVVVLRAFDILEVYDFSTGHLLHTLVDGKRDRVISFRLYKHYVIAFLASRGSLLGKTSLCIWKFM